jgi:hypothetical protein
MSRILRAGTRSRFQPSSAAGKGTVSMENCTMLDILMLAIGLGFFALLALYGIASERL